MTSGHGGIDRFSCIVAQRQDVYAVAHSDRKADCWLTIYSEHRLRRIGQRPANLGNVSQADQAPVRRKIDIEQITLGLEGAGHADQQFLVAGLERARRNHGILRLECIDQRGAVNSEASKLACREFDIDLLVLRAKDLDLGDVLNQQQLRAHVLDIIAQLTMAEAISGERINKAVGVAEIIVEAGADHALG